MNLPKEKLIGIILTVAGIVAMALIAIFIGLYTMRPVSTKPINYNASNYSNQNNNSTNNYSSSNNSATNNNGSSTNSNNTTKTETYAAGTYEVGVEIPAGTYVMTGGSTVQFNETESPDSELLSFGEVGDYGYIELAEGNFVTVTGELTPLADSTPLKETEYQNCTILAGRDIDPGTYTLEGLGIDDDFGHYAIYTSPFNANYTSEYQLQYTNFNGTQKVKIDEGQYLTIGEYTVLNMNNQ